MTVVPCLDDTLGMANETKAITVKAIKALGMSARWDSTWQEFVVDYLKSDPRRTPDSSYHTTDGADAFGTANYMRKAGR